MMKNSLEKKGTITFGFVLGSKPRKNGRYAVVFRITQNRKSIKINTPLEARKSDWNQKAREHNHFKSSDLDAKVKNEQLHIILEKYKEKYVMLDVRDEATKEKIVKTEDKEISFLNYAKKVTKEVEDEGRYRDYKKHNSFVRKLEMFLKSRKQKDLLFVDIKMSLLRDFDNFLHSLPNERNAELKLHQNSIAGLFRIFKRILNKAISIDGLMKVDDNPFLKPNNFTKEIKVLKTGLDISEIEKIEALDLERDTLIWHTRNAFLFSFYNCGIRSGDLLQLRWSNIVDDGQYLHYIMGKSHKVITNELLPQAKEILASYKRNGTQGTQENDNDYIFPFLDKNKPWFKFDSQKDKDKMPTKMKEQMYRHIDSGRSKMNNNLKKIAKQCGITKELSTHIARHTFAKYCVDNQVDITIVKSMLGHSKDETTRRYCGEFDSSKKDAVLNQLFVKPKQDVQEDNLVEQLKGLTPEQLMGVLAQVVNK